MASSSMHDQHMKDALLIVWDILGDLNVDDDDAITQKRDQLRRCLSAIDVPKSTAKKARQKVDGQEKNAVLARLDDQDATVDV